MSKRSGACAVLLPSLVLILAAGCGDDRNPTDTPASLSSDEILTSATIAEATTATAQVAATSVMAADLAAVAFRDGRLDRMLKNKGGTCPQVAVSLPDSGAFEITLDFGTSCTYESGYTAAGILLISYQARSNPETIVVDFNNFTINGLALDGTLTAAKSGTEWIFTYSGSASGGSGSLIIMGTYAVSVNLGGTPNDSSDDSAAVTGSGSVTAGGKTYAVEITEPLAFSSGCSLPVDGALTYQQQTNAPSLLYTVDFGTAGCCTVTVTVAQISQDVDLCTVQ